jgi:hypothetical protein
MAGRKGLPSLSTLMTVPRWVVMAAPAIRSIGRLLLPESLTGPAKCLPEDVRVLFSPSRLIGKIGRKRNELLCQELPFKVKDQCFQALGSVVDGEQEVFIVHWNNRISNPFRKPYSGFPDYPGFTLP